MTQRRGGRVLFIRLDAIPRRARFRRSSCRSNSWRPPARNKGTPSSTLVEGRAEIDDEKKDDESVRKILDVLNGLTNLTLAPGDARRRNVRRRRYREL